MQNENFSPQESIELIQRMIHKTKNAAADSSVFFLLWGWVVFVGCLLQYFLKIVLDYPQHYYAWFVIVIGIAGSIYLGIKRDKTILVKTYISAGIEHLWTSIGITYFISSFIFGKIGYENSFTFYMLLYGIGCFATGRILQFSPLVWGGIGAWLLAILSVYLNYDANILVTALSILISYIIPGYLLRMKYRKKTIN